MRSLEISTLNINNSFINNKLLIGSIKSDEIELNSNYVECNSENDGVLYISNISSRLFLTHCYFGKDRNIDIIDFKGDAINLALNRGEKAIFRVYHIDLIEEKLSDFKIYMTRNNFNIVELTGVEISTLDYSHNNLGSMTIEQGSYIHLIKDFGNSLNQGLFLSNSQIDNLDIMFSDINVFRMNQIITNSLFFCKRNDPNVEEERVELFLEDVQGKLKFQNIYFSQIQCFHYFNNENIVFSNCKSTSMEIINSDLGASNFLGLDWIIFKKVRIDNSNFNNIILKEFPAPSNIDVSETSAEQREKIFNHFKQIAQRNGDIHKAVEFQALEYNNLLQTKKPKRKDRISLWLNKWSNNHGESWFKGICFIFILALLSYIALYASFKWGYFWSSVMNGHQLGIKLNRHFIYFMEYIFNFTNFSLSKFIENTNAFSKDIAHKGIQASSVVIFILGKIAIAYGIYQTAQAFRKYGKGK